MYIFLEILFLLLALVFTMLEINQTFNLIVGMIYEEEEDYKGYVWVLAIIFWVAFYYMTIR